MADYMTPAEVCEMVPGVSVGTLAALRFRGTGPRYRKPTPKTVVYLRAEIIEWVEASARRGTSEDAA